MARQTRLISEAPKVPPHSIEAEQGVLGSMLISREAIPLAVEKINEDYFHIPSHRTIYSQLVELWESGSEIDLITFTQHLRDKKLLEGVGGAPFITSLFTFVPTAANIGWYLDIMCEKYHLRRLITVCTEGVLRAHEEPEEVNSLIAETQLSVAAIVPKKTEYRSLSDYVMEKIERMESGEPDSDVIKTGLTELDRLSPLHKGDMPLLVGDRKAGKSILAVTILENICIDHGKAGLYFSLESPVPEVMDRIFAGVSRIPMDRHHIKRMTPQEHEKSTRAAEKIRAANLIVRDDVYDLTAILATSKKVIADNPELAVIIIDYAQLVRAHMRKDANREREVATISRAVRLFAMEHKVPMILLSQLNKDGEARESKALEQDTTACWHMKRSADDPKVAKIHIPYQRNGESGVSAKVTFLGNLGRVENYAPHKLEFEKK